MKKLIKSLTIALSTVFLVSCSQNEKLDEVNESKEKFSFTYNQKNYNFSNDVSFYDYSNSEYYILLYSNKNKLDGYHIGIEGKPNQKNINPTYIEFGKEIKLTNFQFSITKDDGKYISGNFTSNELTGNFENIKREN